MRLLLLSLALWTAVATSASTASAVAASTLFPRDRPLRTAAAAANATSVAFRDAIVDARPANLSDSYDLVARVALRSFSLAFDAAPADGRVHSVHSVHGRNGRSRTLLGPLAHELLASLGPEGAALVQHVAPRLVFDAADRSAPPVALHDELRVDLNALFMHNVGATQVLMRSLQQLQRDLVALQQLVDDQQQIVFNLTSYLEQEASAQLVETRRIAEAEAAAAEARVNETLARGEQERETLDKSLANELELEKRRHELANERLLREDEARKEQNRDLVRLQEEANVRLEMSRRETENLLRDKQLALEREKALLERNTTLEKAAMDVEGRIRQQRANQDIERAQLAQRLEAEREKLLLAMQTAFDNIGRGAAVLLAEDKEKLVQLVGALVALAAGVFLSREAVRVAGALIQQRLGKPSLVRETSRVSGVVGLVRVWGSAAVRLVSGSKVPPKSDAMLNDVVLGGLLETRVREIARATRNAALHGAPYRHLLLYGPPGTGKTMVAKRLASGSGMDYAILSGGDVGPLGSDAVTELHALFAWANASPRGVLIFIDEAEAFLGCRASRKTHMSEAMRNALNALLFHTGSPSKSFMLVIATNRPEDLDAAVTDRIDDALHFDLPEAHERVRLLEMYFDEYVGELAGENSKLGKRRRSATSMLARLLTGGHSDDDTEEIRTASATDAVDPVKPDARAMLAQYGELTAGMSGREIAKTMLYLQSVVYAQDELAVPRALVDRVVREKADEHRRKLALKAGSSMGNSAMSLGEGVFV